MTMSDVRYSLTASGPDSPEIDLFAAGGFPGVPVDPPPLTATPVNLLRSSRNPTDSTRWTNGFTYLPLNQGNMHLFNDCGPDNAVVPVNRSVKPSWQPYVAAVDFQCSTIGFDEADYSARAKGLLDAATPKMVEYEFWHGLLSQAAGWNNLYLTAGSADLYTATTIQGAIGICEQYLGEMGYGGRGMIHIPPVLAPYLGLVTTRREGNLLLTNRDTIVVPGSGYGQYPAPGPGAKPPQPVGPFVVVATGLCDFRMTDIMMVPEDGSQMINRQTNTVIVRAERYACASWDGQAFCHVDLTLTL